MKATTLYTLIAAVFSAVTTASAQKKEAITPTYGDLMMQAEKFYAEKSYKKAFKNYDAALKELNDASALLFMHATLTAAQAGKKTEAVDWLQKSLRKGWLNIDAVLNNKILKDKIGKTDEWLRISKDLVKQQDKRLTKQTKYESVRKKLEEVYDDNQEVLREMTTFWATNPKDTLSIVQKYRLADSTHKRNLRKVVEVLDKYGWVSVEQVGEKAQRAQFLAMYYGDVRTVKKYFPRINEHKILSSQYAILSDKFYSQTFYSRTQYYTDASGLEVKRFVSNPPQRKLAKNEADFKRWNDKNTSWLKDMNRKRAKVGLEPIELQARNEGIADLPYPYKVEPLVAESKKK
ncbi:MAG: hypothetical protein RI894_1298 [Bacteroidota bacterium]|jgi:glutaredoxin-related protein